MKSRDRKALWITAAVVLLFSVTGGMVISGLGGTGMIEVCIDGGSSGADVAISIPAAMAVLCVGLVPADLFSEIDEEAAEYIGLARLICAELDDVPDCVLVDVRDGDETVRIAKEDGRLLIHVRERRERVSVAIPLRAVDRVLKKVGSGRVIL